MNTHFKPTRFANELRRQGRDVIGLSQGEFDFALYLDLGAQQDDELQGAPRKNHGTDDCKLASLVRVVFGCVSEGWWNGLPRPLNQQPA
jgi:hypothetical protein